MLDYIEAYVFGLRVLNVLFVLVLVRYFYIALAARKRGRRILGVTKTIFLYVLFDAIFAVSVILPIENLHAVMWLHLFTETIAIIGKLSIIIYSVFPHERQILTTWLIKIFGGIKS